jgi:hypothetical protein
MILRKALSTLIVCSFFLVAAPGQTIFPDLLRLVPFTSVVFAQDLSKTVLPITQLKLSGLGVDGKFGTGFCLDPDCRFIGTNYHLAVMARPRKIKGEEIIQRYLATGPDDEDATVNDGFSVGPMRFTLSRDLAIFELRHPLPHYHGISFSLKDLQIGQQVDIYAYPKESINPIRSLLRFQGAFRGETTTGLLAFDYSFSDGKAIRPGGSGGLVVDSKTQQVVGVLNGVARTGEALVLAVPIQSLADFVSKVRPFLAQEIFPAAKEVSPVSRDFYPEFVSPQADVLQHRPEEPYEVSVLRQKAQLLADSMRNFIAVQSYAWGSGDREPDAQTAYQVRVIDLEQRFRSYPDGKKELKQVPFPHLSGWILPADEWSQLPKMVGTELRLKIHQAADVVVNGRLMKVFQYYASVEDNLCPFTSVEDFVFFTVSKTVAVACYGEVWTDEDTNIIRMSEHLVLSDKLREYKGWENYETVLTYGLLERANEPPRLVPLAIFAQARRKKRIYWCRGHFTDYQVFTVKARLIANDY